MSSSNGNDKKKFKINNENGNSKSSEDKNTRPPIGRGRGRADSSTESSTSSEKTKTETSVAESIPSENRQDGRAAFLQQGGVLFTRPQHITTKHVAGARNIELYANYFRLNLLKGFEFIQYRVDFSPEIELVKLRQKIISQTKNIIHGYVYDKANLIYLTRRLESKKTVIPVQTDQGVVNVTFRQTDQVIKSTDNMAMQILNCILRSAMGGLDLVLIRRNMFDPKARIRITDWKLELWPGYVTSIRQHENAILVNCEITHKVLRLQTALDIMMECRPGSQSFEREVTKELVGAIVMTKYNNRTYKIDDINFDVNPKLTFQAKEGEISLVKYYRDKYNITIRDLKQPLLVSNPKPQDIRMGRTTPVLLVPELCTMTGITDKERDNFHLMRAMGEHSRLTPEKRVIALREFSRRIEMSEKSVSKLEEFNVVLERELVQVGGRILKQEEMIFGDGKVFPNDSKADWTKNIRYKMFKNQPLKKWGIICPQRCKNDLEQFLKVFNECAAGQQYEIGKPMQIELPDDRVNTYSREVERFCSKDPKFVMIVLPNNAADRYSSVKVVTNINHAIPSQVVVHKTIQPKKNPSGLRSIATKILLQINAKLGGAPWMINFPLSGVMTVGFDVTHDSSDKKKSYGAFVASMDLKKQVKFYSSVSYHSDGTECSNNISIHMHKALITFREEHGTLPERILFYRDGVGEGQIPYIHANELEQVKKVFASVYGQVVPKFAFIIVSKRINTRIFAKQSNKFENPCSGTVVDDDITLPERYDFFLISQSVNQGTVSPTNYNVIHDSFGLPPERLQILTYKMCHLYYNWSGTTRVPAVVQYAHKLSVLVGQFLHRTPNEGLDTSLYYL